MTRYPNSACEEHKNVKTGEPVCIICMEAELDDLRARLEKAEPIVAAARNLIEQKGRHNTEIAYKRLADAIAKERT